jgi:predicted phage tail protein
MLREVKLYGHLRKKFGKLHKFDIERPIEAVLALKANFADFEQELIKGSYKVYVGDSPVETGADLVLQGKGAIKIVPIVSGAGNGFGQVLVGAALIAFAYFNPMGLAANSLWLSASMNIGIGLTIGGLSQMLFPQTIPNQGAAADNYAFSGPVNTTNQGNPVPILYGRLTVGSQVISSAFSTDQIPV